jgi:hypothetical protein
MTPVRPRSRADWVNRGVRAADLVLVGRNDRGVNLYVPTTSASINGSVLPLSPPATAPVPDGSRLHRPRPNVATPERAAEERLLRKIAADRGGWGPLN